MAENRHKHIEVIQGVLDRLSRQSFLLKGWTVAFVSAALAFSSNQPVKTGWVLFLITLLPIILLFWSLDGFFLWQERLYRRHYDNVCRLRNEDIDFSMEVDRYKGETTWLKAIFSKTLVLFYGVLIFLTICSQTVER